MLKKLRLISVVAMSLFASACFLNNLLYKHLDWIIQYQVDRYFDLNKAQKKIIEGPISESVTWFKRERLPEVIVQLRAEFEAIKNRRLDPQSSARWMAIFDENRRLIVERLLQVTVSVAVTLEDDQIQHLKKMLERSNKTLRRAVEGSESDFPEHLEDYAESTWDRFEYLMGPLRDDQKSLVIKEIGWNRETLRKELAIRETSQDAWITVLKSRDPQVITEAIRRSNNLPGVVEPTESHKYYHAKALEWMRVRELLATSIDAKQWAHMEKKIGDILDEVTRLAGVLQ